MKTPTILAILIAVLGSGCLYTGAGTLGLPCNTDTECGGTQRCIERVCGGPQLDGSTGLTSEGSGDSSSDDGPPLPSGDDDEVRTQCEPSETECLDDGVLRLCTDDGKLSTRDCEGWCGEGTPDNGCQSTPSGADTCFCLNPREPCTAEGEAQCDGDNVRECVDGFWLGHDCDTICIDGGYAGGVDYCQADADGPTCYCLDGGCEEGARRCLDGDSAQECINGSWQSYGCSEVCTDGTYSRGCTYFAGETESCGCWEE